MDNDEQMTTEEPRRSEEKRGPSEQDTKFSNDQKYGSENRTRNMSNGRDGSRDRDDTGDDIGDRPRKPPNSVIGKLFSLKITPLAEYATESEVSEVFEKFGSVKDVYIPKVYGTKKAKGFGFVRFSTLSDADAAQDACLNGQVELAGSKLEAEIANEKAPRRREPPRSSDRYSGGPRGGDNYDSRRRDYGGGGGRDAPRRASPHDSSSRRDGGGYYRDKGQYSDPRGRREDYYRDEGRDRGSGGDRGARDRGYDRGYDRSYPAKGRGEYPREESRGYRRGGGREDYNRQSRPEYDYNGEYSSAPATSSRSGRDYRSDHTNYRSDDRRPRSGYGY